ncbi:transposase [Streptomyces sp. NBC_00237]|uniref:NF041680 family putative transposase n=1 Tax=Streptomyces sp. NBC_00237 TaxID=2975687 RepID=UPI0022544794|nr:NF041680 family putative transposase [Streptomyces sp. NBC_00237]MCX5206066.1 transposase [Streptomyces sp. NBC_00237]
MSLPCVSVPPDALGQLSRFRADFYGCLTGRADALFELSDALLCSDGPVKTLVGLALAPELRRGHGALYGALNQGRIEVARLRRVLASVPLPRAADGRLVLAVDVSPWLRPDAATSNARSFCHTYGRGENKHLMIPGWPYSWIVALETGRTSWTAPLDAVRLRPGDDLAAVTAAQVRELVGRLILAGQWREGDPLVWIVVDAGYDVMRLAYLLQDLPVELLGRLRSDRVMRRPAPSRREYYLAHPQGGHPPRHGSEFIFKDTRTWGVPAAETKTTTTRYGTVHTQGWDRLHPELQQRSAWRDHPGKLPVIEGTVIRLQVDHLPSGGDPKPLWLWWSRPTATTAETDLAWQAFLRRFDIEHFFRMIKQNLGWTAPKLRDPAAADNWTWLVIAAYTQLRLARSLAVDLRRLWERAVPSNRLTPARVRRRFRHLHAKIPTPARVPKPTRPGPGRPPGSKNHRPAPLYDVGLELATGQPYRRPTHHKTGTKPRRSS